MARPTRCTPERRETILAALRDGVSRRGSALAAGIDERTLERWAQRYVGFADEMTRAEGESEAALVRIVRKAAEQDWRAGLALLERRFPEMWGKRDKIDVTVTRREAERMAEELGLNADEIMAEAERIVSART